MRTDEETYNLTHRASGTICRVRQRHAMFRFRLWMGRGLEPICLVVLNKTSDVGPDTRFAIRDAILGLAVGHKRIRYFECVISSQRIITEVYFPGDRSVTSSPVGELRSLAYLEKVLGLQVSVL